MSSLLILGILLLFALFTPALKPGRFSSFINLHNLKLVWVIYSAILLLSVAALYVFFQPSVEGAAKSQGQYIDIYTAVSTGKLDQTEGIQAKSKWSFACAGGELDVVSGSSMMLWAQRKESDDGKIDVVYYTGKNTLDGVDFTEKLRPPTVELRGNKLVIENPEHYQINLSRFVPDLTAQQFLEKDLAESSFSREEGLLLVRIPKGLQLNSTQSKLRFVGE